MNSDVPADPNRSSGDGRASDSPVDQDEFLARGEQAWQNYLQTGQSRAASDVFDRIQQRIDARRRAVPNAVKSGGLLR